MSLSPESDPADFARSLRDEIGGRAWLVLDPDSGRYRASLWNYDDAAADTYPFLFWAAWYTDLDQVNGPVLDVLKAEQKHGNHLFF